MISRENIKIQYSNSTVKVKKSTIKKSKFKNRIVLDQKNTPLGSRGGLEITKNQNVAQSFSITKAGKLISMDIVDMKQHRCKPKKSLYISLISMENNRLGSHTFYTRELHANEIKATIKLYFGSSGPDVKPGQKYAVYLQSDAKPGGCTYAWGGGIETYADGNSFINKHSNIRDMKFRTFIFLPAF